MTVGLPIERTNFKSDAIVTLRKNLCVVKSDGRMTSGDESFAGNSEGG